MEVLWYDPHMQIVSFVLLLTLVMSCGKAPKDSSSNETSEKLPAASPLKGKTKEEILKLKYSGGITLYCALRAHKGQTVDLMASPTSDFFWYMPEELSVYKVLNYSIGKKDMVTVIKLNRPIEFPETQNFTDENFREYYMEHSPIVPIAYKRAAKSVLSDGTIGQRTGYVPITLRERVETRLFTRSAEDENGNQYVVDVRCTVQTFITDEFVDQWQILR